MERPDLILFDLDGTIVDSRWPYSESLNKALAGNGLPTHAPEELYKYLGPPIHDTLKDLGIPEELGTKVIEDYRKHYIALGSEGSDVFDGMRELLAGLQGRLRLAVATSKARLLAVPLLEDLGLAGYFDEIVGPGAVDTDEPKAVTVGRALTLLEPVVGTTEAGTPRAVMVGDRLFDVLGAGAHGIPTVGVLWGVGSADELTEAGAAALIEHPSELPALLSL